VSERLLGRLRELIGATTDEFRDQAPDRCPYPALYYLSFGVIDLALARTAQSHEKLIKEMMLSDTYSLLLASVNFMSGRTDVTVSEIAADDVGSDEVCVVIVQVPLETQTLAMTKENGATLTYNADRDVAQNPDGPPCKELVGVYSRDTDIIAFGSAEYPSQGTSASLRLSEVFEPRILRTVL